MANQTECRILPMWEESLGQSEIAGLESYAVSLMCLKCFESRTYPIYDQPSEADATFLAEEIFEGSCPLKTVNILSTS